MKFFPRTPSSASLTIVRTLARAEGSRHAHDTETGAGHWLRMAVEE
jgi:hypothetical protein